MLLSRISSIFSKRKGEISKLIKLDRNLMTGIMEIMKTSNESFSSSQTMRMTIDCARRSINSQFHTLILSFYRSLIIPLFTKSVDNYGSKEETGTIPYFICTSWKMKCSAMKIFFAFERERFDRWMKRVRRKCYGWTTRIIYLLNADNQSTEISLSLSLSRLRPITVFA